MKEREGFVRMSSRICTADVDAKDYVFIAEKRINQKKSTLVSSVPSV